MEGQGGGLGGFLSSGGRLPDLVESMAHRSLEAAAEYGIVVGRVSRFHPARVGPGSLIRVEVDPETYYSMPGAGFQRVGDYLVIVDLKGETLVLARVVGVERSDLLSILGAQGIADSAPISPDPLSLATVTIVEVEPVMEASPGRESPVPASTAIEPQSPVVDPKPEVLSWLLSLPGEGVLLGALATPSDVVKEGRVPVRLPYKALLQHVLVIGTTGSGKTTLLKNIASDIYSRWTPNSPTLVFVDMNQDFIQLPFPPLPGEGDPVEALYTHAGPVPGLVIVLPVPDLAVSEWLGPSGWCSVAEEAARAHYREAIQVLEGGEEEPNYVSLLRRGHCIVEARRLGRTIAYIPYTINTMTSDSDSLTGLMPGLTMLARELFKRTRDRFMKRHGFYPPLPVMAAAIRAYYEAEYRKYRDSGAANTRELVYEVMREILENYVQGWDRESSLEAARLEDTGYNLLEAAADYYELLRSLMPHKGTLEALYRRLTSLLETGVIDIIYLDGDTARVAPEPGWDLIVGEAEDRRSPVVLDLRWPTGHGLGSVEGPRLLAYRMLARLRDWKHRLWAERSREASKKIVVVIDEAHQFFPQERGSREEQEASRQVAGMISNIARLGRARGIGLVFATHSPRDLHDIILQLANTKIILRTEKNQLESLDLPSDAKKYLPFLPDRHMIVASYVYRGGYVMAKTAPPRTMHYDISIT